MESAAPHPPPPEKPLYLAGWLITLEEQGPPLGDSRGEQDTPDLLAEKNAACAREESGIVQSAALILRRSRHWRVSQYRKALLRFAFALFLLATAIATVRSGLGVPNPGLVLPLAPQRLPEAALVLSVIFVLRAAWIAGSAWRAPTQYRATTEHLATNSDSPAPVDPLVESAAAGQPTLWQRRDDSAPWQPVVARARAVVVSERWSRRGRRAEVSWGGLHLWPAIASQDDRRQVEHLHDLLQVGKQRPDAAGETDLQRVGQQLAQALALPYHYLTKPAQIAEQRRAPAPADETVAPLAAEASPFPAEPAE
ncbi:MAG: hypothetical protein OXG09_02235 [Chloroflexi bacterium]|nr:hypothetical protein [Chloroflexota bacterium]